MLLIGLLYDSNQYYASKFCFNFLPSKIFILLLFFKLWFYVIDFLNYTRKFKKKGFTKKPPKL